MRERHRTLISCGGGLIFGVAFSLLSTGCGKPSAPPKPPIPEVTVVTPVSQAVQGYEDFPARIEAVDSVDVRARVTGFLQKVHFVEGSEVREGDVLFSIDPREYQADADNAEAALQQAEARLQQSINDYQRATLLKRETAISAQELERQSTARREAEGQVRAAKSAVARTRLNLDFCEVRAPISGMIGRTNITVGNLIESGDSLTSIVMQSPIYAYFDVPERVVLRWSGRPGAVPNDTDDLIVRVGLMNETGFTREGRVNFSGNQIKAGTGTLEMRAQLANDDRQLKPGMYARVRMIFKKPQDVLLLPERAIGVDQGQQFVYVVDAENKIAYRRVTTGQMHDGMRAVLDGIAADDRVVSEGLQMLRAGMTVRPKSPAGEPGSNASGTP